MRYGVVEWGGCIDLLGPASDGPGSDREPAVIQASFKNVYNTSCYYVVFLNFLLLIRVHRLILIAFLGVSFPKGFCKIDFF